MKSKFGILGQHISYSMSPVIHPEIGKFIDKHILYDLNDIDESQLGTYIDLLRQDKYQGYNVTKPYKETVLNYIDVMSQDAHAVQAINTIYCRDGMIYGDNTDIYGFRYLLDYYQIDVENKRVLILGTGGAAKAVAFVLKEKKAVYSYASRDDRKILDQKIVKYEDVNPTDYDIYIQATPIGTTPNINDSILRKDQVTNQIVVDLIYRPKVTKLMSYADKTYNGFMMLLAQAVRSEILWLNEDLEVHDIINHLKEVISYE